MLATLVIDELKFHLLTKMQRSAGRGRFSGIVIPVDDLIGRRVMATGAFERTQFDAVEKMIEDPSFAGVEIDTGGLFVDVGANIGLYCVAFADRFPAVLAVEANPTTHAVLKANLALRRVENVTTLCQAASDGLRDAKIYVPTNGNLGWATLNAGHHTVPVTEADVLCRPLDAMVAEHGGGRRVGLVKIDVEGHELSVLNGARSVLKRDRPVVLFEVLDAKQGRACGDLLLELGYDRFCTFKRSDGGRLNKVARGIMGRLDVRAVSLDVDGFHHAALVCASAPRLS